jgi:hypothetical protein
VAKQYVLLHDRLCGSALSRADGYLFGLDYVTTYAQDSLHMTPALVVQSRKRGLQPSSTRTHYSAGRVSALLNMPPQTLSVWQKRHLDAFMRFCPGAHKLRRFVL